MGLLNERLLVEEIAVEIRRSRRRKTRIGLGIDPSGLVILEAPLHATTDELQAVVVEHQRWLRRRLQSVQQDALCVSAPKYESGELVQYLGQAYELVVSRGANAVELRERSPQLPLFPGVQGIRGELLLALPDTRPEQVAERIRRWYRREAHSVLAERLQRFAGLPWLGDDLPPWRTRFMRSQWGSCSVDGRVALNTHLVKTPARLIDYVILHELCHLQHHDHSRRFYGLLEAHMPDWAERSAELDRYLPVLLHE